MFLLYLKLLYKYVPWVRLSTLSSQIIIIAQHNIIILVNIRVQERVERLAQPFMEGQRVIGRQAGRCTRQRQWQDKYSFSECLGSHDDVLGVDSGYAAGHPGYGVLVVDAETRFLNLLGPDVHQNNVVVGPKLHIFF